VDEAVVGSAALGMALGLAAAFLCSRALRAPAGSEPDPARLHGLACRWTPRRGADPRVLPADALSARSGAGRSGGPAPPPTPRGRAKPGRGLVAWRPAAKKVSWLLFAFLLVLSAASFAARRAGYRVSAAHGVHWFPPNPSRVEKRGLMLTVTAVRRRGDLVAVDYALHRLPSQPSLIFWDGWVEVAAHFQDGAGNRLGGGRDFVVLDGRFTGGERDSCPGTVELLAPQGAAFVSIGLPGLDLTTKRVAVPANEDG
jgi:hypothetical protein